MKRAMVTGANGFVGTWLVQELSRQGVQVYAVVKDEKEPTAAIRELPGVEIVFCGLAEISKLPEKIRAGEIDSFYHLAWVGSAGALRADYAVQLKNAGYCCDAAGAAKQLGCKKFLCAGSITEKIAEEAVQLRNVSQNMMYGISKKTAHMLLEVYCKMIGIELIWMRFSNIYGPGDRTNNLISYTLNTLLRGETPAFSKGLQPYDFIFVEDLVHAAYLLGENAPAGDYFLGSGKSRLLREYLVQIPEILGGGYKVGLGERPEDNLTYQKEWFDTAKLEQATGFAARYSFEEGIRQTFRWL